MTWHGARLFGATHFPNLAKFIDDCMGRSSATTPPPARPTPETIAAEHAKAKRIFQLIEERQRLKAAQQQTPQA